MKSASNCYMDKRFVEVLDVIKDTIDDRSIPRAARTKHLEDILQLVFDDFESYQRSYIDDQRNVEGVLAQTADHLAKIFRFGGKKERDAKNQFRMLTKCNTCSGSKKENIRNESRQMQEHTVGRHVYEAEFYASDLNMPDLRVNEQDIYEFLESNGFYFDCPVCETPLEIVYTTKIILPLEPNPVRKIVKHEKSGPRYAQKTVHEIFMSDLREIEPNERSRSLIDRSALALIANYLPGRGGDLRKLFKKVLRYNLQGKGDIGDEACMEILRILKRQPEEYGKRNLQNNIADPIVKISKITGAREEYKMLQFPIRVGNLEFEGQIKTFHTYQREQDEKCAFNHHTYAEKENKKRLELWDQVPDTYMVYDALMKIFARGRKR
jgi:hypothetical protein